MTTENKKPDDEAGRVIPGVAAGADGYAQAPLHRPMWKYRLSRLWPWKHQDMGELPEWAQDAIYCETRIELSFADRLRVLISGRVRVRSQTLTENKPGRVETVSLAHPLAPAWLEGGK